MVLNVHFPFFFFSRLAGAILRNRVKSVNFHAARVSPARKSRSPRRDLSVRFQDVLKASLDSDLT